MNDRQKKVFMIIGILMLCVAGVIIFTVIQNVIKRNVVSQPKAEGSDIAMYSGTLVSFDNTAIRIKLNQNEAIAGFIFDEKLEVVKTIPATGSSAVHEEKKTLADIPQNTQLLVMVEDGEGEQKYKAIKIIYQ